MNKQTQIEEYMSTHGGKPPPVGIVSKICKKILPCCYDGKKVNLQVIRNTSGVRLAGAAPFDLLRVNHTISQ